MKLVVLLAMGVAGGFAGGCGRPLFPEDAARSPYERYMALRGDAAPQSEKNSYGREQPALRQRLRPMDQP